MDENNRMTLAFIKIGDGMAANGRGIDGMAVEQLDMSWNFRCFCGATGHESYEKQQ